MQTTDECDEELEIDLATLVASSSKFIFLKRLLEEEILKNKKKMLLFSGFDYALDCCEAVLENLGIQYVRLDGRTSIAMRKYNVYRFMHREQYKVFVMATRAGGEGITLTTAEVVCFLDLDFNPQVTAQAESRTHRIGQTRPVTVYKLCTKGTVEAQMEHRIHKKIYLAVKIIDDFSEITTSDMFSGPAESEMDSIRRLIQRSANYISIQTFNPEQLLAMQWNSILDVCKEEPGYDFVDTFETPSLSPSSPTADDDFKEQERAWLSRSGKIQTGLFDGQLFRPRRSTMNYGGIPTDLSRKDRRIGKKRVLFDEDIGYWVSKESMLCKDWEAVPTMTPHIQISEPKVRMKHLEVSFLDLVPLSLRLCFDLPNCYKINY